MKFAIFRTGGFSYHKKPCKEARKEAFVRVDERTVDDPRKIPVYIDSDGGWYNDGRNHRVENGHIKRDFDDEHFVIEINSLDELMEFVKKYGRIVVNPKAWTDDTLPQIEIYDDYRE